MLYYVVDLVEWTWTLIAFSGLATCIWAAIDSYYDRLALQRLKTDGDGLMIVAMNLRATKASLLLHVFFLGLGIFALLMANPPLSLGYVAIAGCYIAVAATNVRAIGLNQLDRVRMRRQKP